SSNQSSRYARYLELGHSAPLCKQEEPTCEVCTGTYLTAKHCCSVPRCKGGAKCSHPTLTCKCCGPGHRFHDASLCSTLRLPHRHPETPVTSTEEMATSP